MITRTKALTLRRLIEKASVSLNDEDALEGVELFPNWKANELYNIGDRVRYEGVLYRCLSMHLSQSDWIPSTSISLWARVLIPEPTIIPDWEQPESTNPYMKGDKVRHNGKVWESDIDYNVYEPPTMWSEVI